mmetsp:Transcript_5397/g.13135  ORF Transcript_5397/g.13135 Transcript_5397/m.13135 type:complete len:427 (-) Transcript_5397:310-1590(-)
MRLCWQGDAEPLDALGKLLQANQTIAVCVELVEKVLDKTHLQLLGVCEGEGCWTLELVPDLLARELLTRLGRVRRERCALPLPVLPTREALRHSLDKVLGGEPLGSAEVTGPAPGRHEVVHNLPHDVSVLVDRAVLAVAPEPLGVLHGTDEGLDHPEGVETGLLPAEVRVPHVRDRAVARLKLLDHCSVGGLPDEVAGDEARRPVHLRDLVREHVAVVVVSRHPEAAVRPSDDLHRRRVADEVLKVAAAPLEEASRLELRLVMAVEHLLHGGPEALLPLEHRLLCDDVGGDPGLQAPREEVVRKVGDVVQRVVVGDCHGVVVGHVAVVHDDDVRLRVLWREDGCETALSDCLPPGPILAADRVAFKEDGLLKPEFDAIDVDRVPADGDAIPAPPHCTVRAAASLLQPKLLLLLLRGCHGGLLENGL